MKLGKVLLGATGLVGAVVFAPVVLPAAAAAGSAALASAGAAVASSAVGTAAIGAMSTLGGAVGTAAGAVGLSSVATVAGTSAGAAAVGTIATSGVVGAVSTVSGAGKLKEASDIKKEAEKIYDTARDSFDKCEKNTNSKLEQLGGVKINAWESLQEFVDNFEKVKNVDFEGDLILDENLKLDMNQLKDIKILSITIKDLLKGGTVALTGGQLAGLATSTGFTSIATASTGTAIAGLHGAAATNASLAALGGGSLASGGLGMAGGTMVMNALAFAPAMAIGGLFINGKGTKNLNTAHDVMKEAKQLKNDMEEAEKELIKLRVLAEKIQKEIEKFDGIMNGHNNWLANKVEDETDYRKYDKYDRKKFKIAFKVAIILKDLTCAELMNSETNVIKESSVNETIKKCNEVYDTITVL